MAEWIHEETLKHLKNRGFNEEPFLSNSKWKSNFHKKDKTAFNNLLALSLKPKIKTASDIARDELYISKMELSDGVEKIYDALIENDIIKIGDKPYLDDKISAKKLLRTKI